MKIHAYIILISFLIGQLIIILPKVAYAYIDLGSGSYFIQIIIAGFLGFVFILKIFWKKIKTFFLSLFIKQDRKKSDEK